MSLNDIINKQRDWAQTTWPGHTSPRAPSLEANLFMPMEQAVRDAFKAGGGSELGTDETPGKMQSLRSSSALAYNVFAPWRNASDLSPLATALGVSLADATISFERKFPHGLPSEPPNLDVVLDGMQPRPLAIESKFTEPYGARTQGEKGPIAKKYFAGGRKRWTEVGLPRCQDIAESCGPNSEFVRLDVAQLLKHLLGLAYTTKATPRLICLWYDAGSDEADDHRRELATFGKEVEGEAEFRALSYQDLFDVLRHRPEPRVRYVEYLSGRYFSD